jgi:hypothetical protein
MKLLASLSLAVFFVFAGLFVTHTLGSINQDVGRHLKTGQIIWQTHSIPKVNLFSFTEPDSRFINHHWLSEVVFYLLSTLIGLKGLILFKTALLTATCALAYAAVRRHVQPLAFILALIPALIIIFDRTDVRPEIFSYFFLAYFLFSIFRAKYEHDLRWLYGLPIIQILWSNMHIYFAFGPGLLALFAFDRFIVNDKLWKRIALLCGICSLITLINPSGLGGALAPFTILAHYGYSIVENQSIFFLKDYGILGLQIDLFILTAVLFLASFMPALKKHGIRLYSFEVLTGASFLILAARMIRNFGPFAIILMPIFALNIQAYFDRINLSTRLYRFAYAGVLTAGILLLYAIPTNRIYGWLNASDRFGLGIPAGAEGGVRFVQDNHLAGPLFNNFDVGSYLIWKLYPEERVFVDGRPEAYSPEFFANVYKPMQEDPRQWKHYADDVYHIEYVFFDYHDITPWAQAFLSSISQDSNWPLVYQDDSTVIFVRRNASHAELIRQSSRKPNEP